MVPLGSPGNKYCNKVPIENILAGTLFQIDIFRGT
jgi:hypothetical protein